MVRRRGQEPTPPDRRALVQERNDLLTRLREIDRALGAPRERAVLQPPEHRGNGCR